MKSSDDYNLGAYQKTHSTFSRIQLDAPPELVAKWLTVMTSDTDVLVVLGQYKDAYYAAVVEPVPEVPDEPDLPETDKGIPMFEPKEEASPW